MSLETAAVKELFDLLDSLDVPPAGQSCQRPLLFSSTAVNGQSVTARTFEHLCICNRLVDIFKNANLARYRNAQLFVHQCDCKYLQVETNWVFKFLN